MPHMFMIYPCGLQSESRVNKSETQCKGLHCRCQKVGEMNPSSWHEKSSQPCYKLRQRHQQSERNLREIIYGC